MGVSACKTKNFQLHCERDNCGLGPPATKGASRVNISRQPYDIPQAEELISDDAVLEEPLFAQQLHGQLATIKGNQEHKSGSQGNGCHGDHNGADDKVNLKKKASSSILKALKSGELQQKIIEAERLSIRDPLNSNTSTKTGGTTVEAPAASTEETQDISPANVDVAIEEDRDVTNDPEGIGNTDLSGRPLPLESKESLDDEGNPTKLNSSPKGLFKGAVKRAMHAHNVGLKVSMENKIGCKLEGVFRDIALALQRGISCEGRSESNPEGFRNVEAEMFSRARVAAGFPPARYYATMGLQEGRQDPTLVQVGSADAAGKSGAFFLLSPDQQLIAKSCTNEDWHTLLKILPGYVKLIEDARNRAEAKQHQKQTTRNSDSRLSSRKNSAGSLNNASVRGFTETLLPRFLGLYSVVVPNEPKPIRVLVMANVFGGTMSIDRRYDLKGSTHGRKASKRERAKKSPVLKDLDWTESEPGLQIGDQNAAHIIETMKQDALFLVKHGLMDYSLLVGVHDINKDEGDPREVMNVVTVKDQSRHCYIGIIDVLTPYHARKRVETFALGTVFCGRDISCQHPKVYANRFINFCESCVFLR